MKRTIPSFALSLLLLACTGTSTPTDGSAPGGKADGAADAECLFGRYVVEGSFPSFSEWTFELREGRLVDSHTDDLTADEWPTTLVRDEMSSPRFSLVQVTHASDAIIETTLHVEQVGCERGGATLIPIAAYTVTWDETSVGEHGFESHTIRLVSGPGDATTRDQAIVDARVASVLSEHGLDRLPFDVPAAELARQEALDNAISFDDALEKALTSFLTDGDDVESPYSLVADELGEEWYDDPCMHEEDATSAVRCFMNRPNSELRLLTLEDRPEGYEDPTVYWIFSLYLDDLSDHGHWAVIDRNDPSALVYNYGFN